jgi:chorismate--pyruvate lyase
VSQRRIVTEPRWRHIDQITHYQLPAAHRPWLLDDGSLTGRLIELRQGRFAVQRLDQGWQVPLFSERRLLGQMPRQQALVREVLLTLADRPVVFARSVFPIASLSGDLGHLRRLQNKSLGAILFKHPGMHRSPFEIAHIPGDSDYLPTQLHQDRPAWARRCRFDIQGKCLMVSEVFLEQFTPWTAPLPVHRTQRGVVSAAIVPATQ